MSNLKLIKSALNSRYVRSQVSSNAIRTIDVKHTIVRDKGGNPLLDFLGSTLKGFISLKLAEFQQGWKSAGNIWNWLVQRTEQIKQFDWNASDKQLESLIEAQNIRIATVWGSALGRSAGWIASIAVGAGVAYLVPVIGGATLARTIAAGAGKEGLSEIGYALGGALEQTFGGVANIALTSGYINYRKFVKSLPTKLLESIYGKSKANWLKNEWGKDSGPNMSFNSGMDDLVESIDNKYLKAFLQAFLQEGWDGFIEGGMVVAAQFDAAYAQAKTVQTQAEGKTRTVKLLPDKQKKGEIVLITGTQKEVETEVVSTLNTYRMISNRDVGQIIGMPADDYLSAKPMRRQLTITFKTKKEPPWKMPDGKAPKEKTVTIPDVQTGLSWQKIKTAAKSYTWGKFRATAQLDNGRQMAVYGASKSEAEKALRRFAALSTAKILSLNVTEEVEKRNLNLRKDPVPIFPAYCVLLVRTPTTGEGRQTLDNQKLKEDRVRIDLWTDKPPVGLATLK